MVLRVTRVGDGVAGATVSVRRATARDARRLTRLVRGSRAYEGPYAAMIAGYRVGPDYIETHRVFVAVVTGAVATGAVTTGAVTTGQAAGNAEDDAARTDERLLGFYALVLDPPELDLMFVADAAQGLGIGRRLVEHMTDEARGAGLDAVRVVSHPPAEGFYRSVGARRTGTVAANPPAVMWDRPELEIPIPVVAVAVAVTDRGGSGGAPLS
ncbi:GNAT family N-acetyltransferase [Streptomyces sp. NPDC092295]|uniref:GNAT family N-acetyltransferase n=1 Tax=Streptomyces sp. NPDC092295 TaxID=3366011 RepID=UPI00382C5FF8